jgi:AraC-like DNA-binding protein
MLGLALEPQADSLDLAMGGLRLIMVQPHVDCGLRPHVHEVPHLVMVFRGRVVDMRGDREHLIGAGHVVLHPPHIMHENQILGPDATLLAIDLTGPSAEAVTALYGGVAQNVRFTFESVRSVPEHIREEALRGDAAASRIIPALVEQLLALGTRVVARERNLPEWLLQAEGIVRRSYGERLTAAELAMRTGISASRLTHGFRDLLGRSLGDFLREVRLGAAVRALLETDRRIGDIALESGFADQSHLTRVFREAKGCTPLEYRRRARISMNGR